LPITLLKIKPVMAVPDTATCLMLSNPRIVMGQLFMKLAPTVTTMLGAKTPRNDGNLLVVSSAEGSNSIEVNISPSSGLVFDNFTYNSYSYEDNPTTISVTSALTVTAYFRAVPNRWVTVYAKNQYEYYGYDIPVYIDSQFVGYVGSSFSISEGYHEIYVPGYLDGYSGGWFEYPTGNMPYNFWYYTVQQWCYNYDNPWEFSVTDDMTIWAYYYTAGKK
jgi:hypothetical protein